MWDLTVQDDHDFYVEPAAVLPPSRAGPTTSVLVHNDSCPTQVYRTPRAGNKDLESNGLNASLHQEGDQSAYLGEKSVVTGHYAGQPGYERGYYEYTMAPEFDDEFGQYKFPYDGGDGMQWQIPADKIDRFNELITGQRWVNYYGGYEW